MTVISKSGSGKVWMQGEQLRQHAQLCKRLERKAGVELLSQEHAPALVHERSQRGLRARHAVDRWRVLQDQPSHF